eukprot:7379985-Prymnesium_polylepis.2
MERHRASRHSALHCGAIPSVAARRRSIPQLGAAHSRSSRAVLSAPGRCAHGRCAQVRCSSPTSALAS